MSLLVVHTTLTHLLVPLLGCINVTGGYSHSLTLNKSIKEDNCLILNLIIVAPNFSPAIEIMHTHKKKNYVPMKLVVAPNFSPSNTFPNCSI